MRLDIIMQWFSGTDPGDIMTGFNDGETIYDYYPALSEDGVTRIWTYVEDIDPAYEAYLEYQREK
eukprot:scaffold70669_cov24-Tisochrysis_lutea.AAC.1